MTVVACPRWELFTYLWICDYYDPDCSAVPQTTWVFGGFEAVTGCPEGCIIVSPLQEQENTDSDSPILDKPVSVDHVIDPVTSNVKVLTDSRLAFISFKHPSGREVVAKVSFLVRGSYDNIAPKRCTFVAMESESPKTGVVQAAYSPAQSTDPLSKLEYACRVLVTHPQSGKACPILVLLAKQSS